MTWAGQAADISGDAGRTSPAGCPLEQHLAGGTLAQGGDGVRGGAGQVVADHEGMRGGLAGIEVRHREAEHRCGRGAEDLARAAGQQGHRLRGGAGGVQDQPQALQHGRALPGGVADAGPAAVIDSNP
jgi:hypothetical protein